MKKYAVVLIVLICIMSLSACKSEKNENKDDNVKTSEKDNEKENKTGEKKEEENKKVTEEAAPAEAGDSDIAAIAELFGAEKVDLPEPVDPKSVDYSKIECTVEYTDADKIKEFMENYKNEVYDNKVVKLTGIMSQGMMDKTKNSVMVPAGNGAKLGPSFIVVGWDENSNYPADGNKIEVTGVVIASWNNDWYASEHYIYVLPENLKDLGYPED